MDFYAYDIHSYLRFSVNKLQNYVDNKKNPEFKLSGLYETRQKMQLAIKDSHICIFIHSFTY